MTVLVCGGAGYIGSHTVRHLRQQGRDVVVVDTMEFGHPESIGDTPYVVADIADRAAIARVVSDYSVDSVVHFAGYKSPAESMADPAKYFTNNVGASNALLRTLDELGVHRVVFSSSCAVYGTPDLVPVSESAPVHPESPYGESKAITERMLRWYSEGRDLRSVSLRYFNAAGAWPDGSIGEDWTVTINLVPLIMKATLGRRAPLHLFGTDYPTADGSAIRDYVHVIDLADAHLKALEYLEAGGTTTSLNLGTGIGSSVFEVIAASEKASGRPVPYELKPRRPGDPVALWADTRQSEAVLGWSANYGLDDILASAWAWHSTHLDGYAST